MPELEELVERVAGWARDGEEVEAYASRQKDTDVRAFGGEVESLSSAESAGIGIRVVAGSRQGFSFAGSLDEQVVADAFGDARDNASFATSDPHAGLARPDGVEPAVLDLWSQELASLTTAAKVDMALELERRVWGADPRIRQVESANYGDVLAERAVATSTGIAVRSRRTACFVSAHAIAGDGDDTQTGVGYSVGRSPSDLDGGEAAGDAAERATRLLGARKARSGRLPVVLDPRVTTTLVSILSATLSGEAVARGRSLFADRVGEQVAVPEVTLVDDPTDPAAYGASSHDGEGLACRRNVPIDGGVLAGFVYDTYSARMSGTESTGSAVRGGFKGTPTAGCRAVCLAPGDLSQAEVLGSVGDGIYVQSITGAHSGINPISGDFSVGAEGLMIHDGSLAEPVREVTIASTIQRMLLSVTYVGADLRWLPGVAAGLTLAIGEMALSGA